MDEGATPTDLHQVVDNWEPGRTVFHDVVEPERCAELASLLGWDPPGVGDPLPALWHVIVGNPPVHLPALGVDGHPANSPLQPPVRQRRRLFGGSTVRFGEPLRVTDAVEHRAHVGSAEVKQGAAGRLVVVTEVHEWLAAGEVRVTEERRIVYRSGDAQTAPTHSVGPAPDPVAEGRQVTVDERGLFVFSHLTANAHRIHYDRRYATEEEGHADLLVHGPLLGILLAGELGGRQPGSDMELDYRLKAPVPVCRELTLRTGSRDGNRSVTGACGGAQFGVLTARRG